MEEASIRDKLKLLPDEAAEVTAEWVELAIKTLGAALRCIVLYGSGAEGRLRITSDINLLVILNNFSAELVDALRQPLRAAHASVNLEVMFLLESELQAASEAFAVKFDDIARRHIVLFGPDLPAKIHISNEARLRRVRQVLLNLTIRLRERYVLTSLREEQLAVALAEAAPALRSSAAALLQLQGKQPPSPREALELVAEELAPGKFRSALALMSQARQEGLLPPGEGPRAVFEVMELAARMRELAETLRG